MQLVLDAADRLVELVEERHGAVPADEAARELFALRQAPAGLVRSLLADVVGDDARLAWRGGDVVLATGRAASLPLEHATYVVVDLETTGLTPRTGRICEIGAVRVQALEQVATFHTLVNPGAPLPPPIAGLTGLSDGELRGSPSPEAAVRRFLAFAADAVLVAHNARFDVGFLDREVERLTSRRIAATVVDTVGLARQLLAGRTSRAGLASLAQFFGTAVRPCHRALPDAQATAEILLALIGLAQERGATTVADLCRLAAPRARRAHDKRPLVAGAPTRPGVYLFRDAHDRVLYVGRARELRARLRSYFGSERQRPAVEAALAALERVEWRVTGSELEAALEELRLIRELRPPANARSSHPERYVYLRQRGDEVVVTTTPTAWGPIRSRRRAQLAARGLAGATAEELAGLTRGLPLVRLRRKLRDLADSLRYEDAARVRDRLRALEQVTAELRALERLRAVEAWLVVPADDARYARAFLLRGGRVAAVRTVRLGAGAPLELANAVAVAERQQPSLAPDDAEELLLLDGFLRKPPPELHVVPLGDVERLRRLLSTPALLPARARDGARRAA